MMPDKSMLETELGQLVREMNVISEDMGSYVNFLIQRQNIIQNFLTESPASNN